MNRIQKSMWGQKHSWVYYFAVSSHASYGWAWLDELIFSPPKGATVTKNGPKENIWSLHLYMGLQSPDHKPFSDIDE